MPIKALKPRLVEAGKIKIGGKSTKPKTKRSGDGEWYPPVKYDEFHVTTLDKDQKRDTFLDDVPLMWLLREYNASPDLRARGDATTDRREKVDLYKPVKIRRIPVVLHSDRIDDVLEHNLTCYLGKKRYKVCDGEVCTKYELKKGPQGMVATGERRQIACECPKSPPTPENPDGFVSKRFWDTKTPPREDLICKPTGILRCMIALDRAGTGIYTFRTTGWQSLSALLGALERLEADCGRIANIPCELVMFQGSGKDASGRTTRVWAVNLRPMQSVRQRLQELKELQSMRAYVTQLPTRRRAIEGEALSPPEGEFGPEFFPEEDLEDEIPDAEFEERDNGADPDSASACVDCGEVTPRVVHSSDNQLRCPPCHKDWADAAKRDIARAAAEAADAPPEREPGEDREEDEAEQPDVQALRVAAFKAWRAYAPLVEHPDGLGALYLSVCEAAGFDGAVAIEEAGPEELQRLIAFLRQGFDKLQAHEPDPTFEDDIEGP